MFPHIFKAGLDKALPRDGVLLAGAAVVYHDTFTSANIIMNRNGERPSVEVPTEDS